MSLEVASSAEKEKKGLSGHEVPILLDVLQSLSCPLMKFDNEDFWNTDAVTDLLFCLRGGKCADASASSTEAKTVVPEDVALMDSLVLLRYEEMIADMRNLYLGRHWSVGVAGGVGVPALVKELVELRQRMEMMSRDAASSVSR